MMLHATVRQSLSSVLFAMVLALMQGTTVANETVERQIAAGDYEAAALTIQAEDTYDLDDPSTKWKRNERKALLRDLNLLKEMPEADQRRFANARKRLDEIVRNWLNGNADDQVKKALKAESTLLEMLGEYSYFSLSATKTVCSLTRGHPSFSKERIAVFAKRNERTFGSDHPETHKARLSLGISMMANDQAKSLAMQRKSLKSLRKLAPDERATYASSMQFAETLARADEGTEAIELSNECLDFFRREGGVDTLVAIQVHARVLAAVHGLQAAVAFLAHESNRWRDHPDSRWTLLRAVAEYQEKQGHVHASMKTQEKILSMLPDEKSVKFIEQRTSLAECCEQLGFKKRAVALAKRSCEDATELLPPNHPTFLASHYEFGRILDGLGKYTEAVDIFQSIAPQLPLDADSVRSIDLRGNIASSLVNAKRFDEASKQIDLIDSAIESIDSPTEYRARHVLPYRARIDLQQGDFAKAIEHLKSALEFPEHRTSMGVWHDTNLLGVCYYALGDVDKAIEIWKSVAEEAEASLQKDSGLLASPVIRDSIDLRGPVASALAGKHKFTEAFLETQHHAGFGLRSALREKWQKRFGEVKTIQEQLSAEAAIVGWLDVDFGVKKISKESWGYVLRNSGPPVFVKLDSTIQESAHDVATMMPSATASQIREACVEFYRERILPLRGQLEKRGELPAVQKLIVVSSGDTASVPIEAIMDLADPSHTFVISRAPSASVFAWLASGRERAANPSALLVADPAGDLASARSMAPRIAKCFSRTTLLRGKKVSDFKLSATASKGQLRDYNVFHFANHVVSSKSPMETKLDFRNDRSEIKHTAGDWLPENLNDDFVTAETIAKNWNLDADLVVLAGCDSNEGYSSSSEGNVGMTQAFLLAGARGVIVTHWPIDDDATALLMDRFYKLYTGNVEGMGQLSAAEALSNAKRWLRDLPAKESNAILMSLDVKTLAVRGIGPKRGDLRLGRRYGHPRHWAAFSFVGAD